MDIRKTDGSTQKFDQAKLAKGLKRAKLPQTLIEQTVDHIKKMARPGTSTNEIHTRVMQFLEERDPASAARYNLKRSMLQLGPSGYPFEQYISRLMQEYGWQTKVGVMIQGRCVLHEIDIYGKREGSKKRAVEAKYHNKTGVKTDLKTALYIKARHDDLTAIDKNIKGVLITNTQFTSQAIAYGECVGMKMKGWDYPKNEGLAKYIEDKQLYPITVFAKIPKHTIAKLTRNGIILAKQLCNLSKENAKQYGINKHQLKELKSNAKSLCNIK